MDAIYNFPTIITEKESPPFESTITYYNWRNITFTSTGTKYGPTVRGKANTPCYIIWGRNCRVDLMDDEFLSTLIYYDRDYTDCALASVLSTRGSGDILFS